ncbi:MAG: hypothetical protein V3S19_00605 [Gemmatimonadales bacterium]
MRSHSLIGGLAGLALCSVAAGGTLPECTIDFEVACPDAAPVCGATFTGGNGCAFEFLLACYSSGLFSYKALPGVPLTITLSGDLNTLEVFFVHQTGASGTMRFFDAVAGGNEILPPLLTNGDCLVAMHPKQFRSFSTPVRRIEVTATGGPLDAVWIDDFRVNAPCPEDVNADGTTNVLDLIQLLLCFGQLAVPGCEAEDINNDGVVNVLDLILLLLAFGTACP